MGCHRALLTYTRVTFADIAQLVEQLIRNEQVRGSNPRVGSKASEKPGLCLAFLFLGTLRECYATQGL
jgi:hypothetical protein